MKIPGHRAALYLLPMARFIRLMPVVYRRQFQQITGDPLSGDTEMMF